MRTIGILERGRDAFERRNWPDARSSLDAADRDSPLPPLDLERLATAAYLTGHDAQSTEAWSRAFRAWQEEGDLGRAVRSAFWLGFGLIQRGDMAQGGGWLGRADRLLAEHGLDTVERGYLMVPSALMAMGSGEGEAALEQFEAADAVGRRFGDTDLWSFGLLGRGQALLSLGRTGEGLRQLDEAMVSVTAGETSPTVSGIVYCAVIDACQRAFDLRRAREWTAALDRWCAAQPGLVPYRGQCLVHRSQVLQVQGEWAAAAAEAERACRWLSDPPHPALGVAHYQRGELLRLRGELRRAEAAYRAAHAAGHDPQPGLALLRLAEGDDDAAAASVAAALRATGDRTSRARLLPAHAEVMVTVGRVDEAAASADELDALASRSEGLLGAVAGWTRGTVLLARGEAAASLGPLHEALEAWWQLGAPYETARVRLTLASACDQVGDRDGAAMEREAARQALVGLGAAPAPEAGVRSPSHTGTDVSPRECEVLHLVAAGHTNREIAAELLISEKTVERHLGNVFAKLGVANRAGATAAAYERGLL